MTPEEVKQLVERLRFKWSNHPLVEDTASALSLLAQRVQKLEERLEITHCWVSHEESNELVRQEIPHGERDSFPDGISCRDKTIDLLDDRLSLLAQEREELRTALNAAEAVIADIAGSSWGYVAPNYENGPPMAHRDLTIGRAEKYIAARAALKDT